MAGERSYSPPYPPSIQQRRASFSPGASLSELFARSGNSGPNGGHTATAAFPSPIGSVAANAQSNQRRRTSITTLGLSGSPPQSSPFASRTMRRESLSSSAGSSSTYFEDVEENENTPPTATATSPFARRFSFGAQALRDVRGGNTAGNGEGFNWSEALRARAERAPSLGASSPPPTAGDGSPVGVGAHHRAASIASMDFPAREMPKQPRRKTPDFFQEKILRADFME